jgi:peptide/nickel transport system substrate-binding protein
MDRQKMIQVAWLGHAKPGSTIVPPATGDWHNAELKTLPFDLAAANRLLDQAGYAKGPDGIRVANGHPMAYRMIFPQDERGKQERAFQIIREGLQQVGVKVTERVLDNDAAFQKITKPDNKYLDFDLAMWDWVPLIDPDFILSVVTCGQSGGWSDTRYCDAGCDKMYQQQGRLTDAKQRQQAIWAMSGKALQRPPLHHPQLRQHSGGALQEVGRPGADRARLVQPAVGAVDDRGPPGRLSGCAAPATC